MYEWRPGVAPDAPGYWWVRAVCRSTDFNGRDESIHLGVRAPVLVDVFLGPRLRRRGHELYINCGTVISVRSFDWIAGGCARVQPCPET